MASAGDTAEGRLAIIAGGGLLPSYVAEAARSAGENPVIVILKDEGDRRWDGFDHATIGIGDFAALDRLFKKYRIDRVVMSGSVRRRPEWREVRPTLRILRKVPSAIRTLLSGGDDTAERAMRLILADHGLRQDLPVTGDQRRRAVVARGFKGEDQGHVPRPLPQAAGLR